MHKQKRVLSDGGTKVYQYESLSFRLRVDQEPMRSAFARAAEIGLSPQAYVRWLIGKYGTPQDGPKKERAAGG